MLIRYVRGEFNDNHLTTIQASYLSKKLQVEGNRVKLSIWDTAGQERFHALGPIYYRDSQGAILAYDITDNDSFLKVKSWVKELRKMLGTDVVLAIVGNKADLEKNRTVNKAEAEEYANSVGAKHYSTSAKLNRGLSEMFVDLSKRMVAQHVGQNPGGRIALHPEEGPRTTRRSDNILIDFEEQQSKGSGNGGCC